MTPTPKLRRNETLLLNGMQPDKSDLAPRNSIEQPLNNNSFSRNRGSLIKKSSNIAKNKKKVRFKEPLCEQSFVVYTEKL